MDATVCNYEKNLSVWAVAQRSPGRLEVMVAFQPAKGAARWPSLPHEPWSFDRTCRGSSAAQRAAASEACKGITLDALQAQYYRPLSDGRSILDEQRFLLEGVR